MKKLIILLILPLFSFSQEDMERYKIYSTENVYTSLLLDSATGKIWQLQIGVGDTDQLKTVLSDDALAEEEKDVREEQRLRIEKWKEANPNPTPEELEYAPMSVDDYLVGFEKFGAKNGRFKLYPTGNMYNFIMVDVIRGTTWQVQWNVDEGKRIVSRFY